MRGYWTAGIHGGRRGHGVRPGPVRGRRHARGRDAVAVHAQLVPPLAAELEQGEAADPRPRRSAAATRCCSRRRRTSPRTARRQGASPPTTCAGRVRRRASPTPRLRLKPLDTWTPEGAEGAGGCASSHYFTTRGDGLTVNAFYGQGVRFLDTSNPRDIRQVGYFVNADSNTWAAYFHDGYVFVTDFSAAASTSCASRARRSVADGAGTAAEDRADRPALPPRCLRRALPAAPHYVTVAATEAVAARPASF